MIIHRRSFLSGTGERSALFRAIVFGGLAAFAAAGCGSNDATKASLASACNINSDCTSPLACSFGKCHAACRVSTDCDTGQLCVSSGGLGVCELSSETTCTDKSDCNRPLPGPPDGRCRNQCHDNVDCLAGQVCTPSDACAEPQDLGTNGDLTSS